MNYIYNRNYGCRYKEIIEKGYRSLVMENEKIRVSIYLDKGSDIYEFLYKPTDTDFMWKSPIEINGNRKTPFTKELSGGNFLDIYEGGWQDILPNIANPTNYMNAGFGFHGELYTLSFKYDVIYDNPDEVKLKLYTRMSRAPLFVLKELTIRCNCPVLEINETIKNEADEEFKLMWGQHPAIGKPFLNKNCVIDVPSAATARTHKVSLTNNEIIPLDREFNWPYIESLKGNKIDLSHIMPEDAKTAFIVYLENISDGWYGITNLEKGIGFGLIWDKDIFKNLWMWEVYRGCYSYPWYGRTYNIALEPWSSVPDDFDEVIKKGDYLEILPGQSLISKYTAIVYESKERINGFDSNYNVLKK